MNEFERHRELLDSDRCSEYEKAYFKRFVTGQADSTDLITAFQNLSQMLDEHYETAPIIIIDEYDTPIHQGYKNGFYEDVVLYMRNLFSGGLKDNKHLSFGFLTGILRVAKESIFSGLNNLKINSVLDMKYSEYFGFTPEEVREIANHYGALDRYEEICTWYDGYRFGNSEIFNPWSVISYFSNQCQPRPFWQATGSNEIIGEILTQADEEITEQLRKLLQGESILIYVDTDVIYPQIKSNPSSIYSFLLVAGYLKVMETQFTDSGDFLCEVALPNREITIVYNKEILQKLDRYIPQSTAISIQKALYTQDLKKLQLLLQTLLQQSVSVYDTYGENFYHGLVLGLCAMMDNRYWIHSNGESGEGRYDIQLMPRLKRDPGILIELKASRKASKGELKTLAEKALNQVDEKKYDTEMKKQGVTSVFKYGVAFSGKNVEVAMNSFSTDHS
jgi:hypothetical protein